MLVIMLVMLVLVALVVLVAALRRVRARARKLFFWSKIEKKNFWSNKKKKKKNPFFDQKKIFFFIFFKDFSSLICSIGSVVVTAHQLGPRPSLARRASLFISECDYNCVKKEQKMGGLHSIFCVHERLVWLSPSDQNMHTMGKKWSKKIWIYVSELCS